MDARTELCMKIKQMPYVYKLHKLVHLSSYRGITISPCLLQNACVVLLWGSHLVANLGLMWLQKGSRKFEELKTRFCCPVQGLATWFCWPSVEYSLWQIPALCYCVVIELSGQNHQVALKQLIKPKSLHRDSRDRKVGSVLIVLSHLCALTVSAPKSQIGS